MAGVDAAIWNGAGRTISAQRFRGEFKAISLDLM